MATTQELSPSNNKNVMYTMRDSQTHLHLPASRQEYSKIN